MWVGGLKKNIRMIQYPTWIVVAVSKMRNVGDKSKDWVRPLIRLANGIMDTQINDPGRLLHLVNCDTDLGSVLTSDGNVKQHYVYVMMDHCRINTERWVHSLAPADDPGP